MKAWKLAAAGAVVLAASGADLDADRSTVLPGLPPVHMLVDPQEPWYEQAAATLEQARMSFVVVQNAQHPDWPPMSGFVVGPSHVATAHLRELKEGEAAPRFIVRTLDGQEREGRQVAGWQEHDFGILKLDGPLDAPAVRFGDERALEEGDILLHIGNPAAASRLGTAVMVAGSFIEMKDGRMRTDLSTAPGGSGGPVLDLDGNVVMMSSTGVDIAVVSIEEMRVSEPGLRSSIPVARGGGESGAAGSVMARLVAEHVR